MSNGIAEEVAVAFKVVDGGIGSCDDADAVAVAAGFFFLLLLLLGAHCDVDDDDIWSVFGSRVGGADFRKNEWVCWFGLVFFFSFGRKLYVFLLPTEHPK